jgi:hypothetical protein
VDVTKLQSTSAFIPEQEESITNHIVLLSKHFHGLNLAQVCLAEFHLVEQNQIKHNFSRHSCIAGKNWLCGSAKRTPSVTLRKKEDTFINKTSGFNEEQVALFTKMYKTIAKYKFHRHIYNMDDASI